MNQDQESKQDYLENPEDFVDPDDFNNRPIQSAPSQIPIFYQNTRIVPLNERINEIQSKINQLKKVLEYTPINQKPETESISSEVDQYVIAKLVEQSIAYSGAQPNADRSVTLNILVRGAPQEALAEKKKSYVNVEGRISVVEQIVGSPQERQNALMKDQNVNESIDTILLQLNEFKTRKLNYKDYVNGLYKKIASLQTEDGNADQKHRINFIFQKVQELQGFWDLIPILVQRLDKLKEAHEMSIGMNSTIQGMTQKHEQIIKLIELNNNKSQLLKVKIQKNYSEISQELEKLDILYSKKF